MKLKLIPKNSSCFSIKISSAQSKSQLLSKNQPLVNRPTFISQDDSNQLLDPQCSTSSQGFHLAQQPNQFNNIPAQSSFPLRDTPFNHDRTKKCRHPNHWLGPSQYLLQFHNSLKDSNFESVIENFNQLPLDQKSNLSTQIYNSMFSLASRIHDDDHLIQSIQAHPSSSSHPHSENKSYKIDYRKLQTRLIKLDQAFQSARTSFSTEQLHSYLQITLLAAALHLREFSYVPTTHRLNTPSSISHPKFDSLFSHLHQLISNIIHRLPELNQIPIPTAHQLAQAIPFETLGIYLRFLVVFHRPNQGLKLIRKVYYAFLISRRIQLQNENNDENHKDLYNKNDHDDQSKQPPSSDSFVIETGSLIISLLRCKIHHRLAALKLAIRMISIGRVYPDQLHFTSLLRRMYMSKSEWNSVIQFQNELATTDSLSSNWLKNQVAIVEAEDGRVERALSLSAEALTLPSNLHGDFLSPTSTLNSDIFAHAIHAMMSNHHHPNDLFPGGLRGAIAIRTKMLESGFSPPPESDDLILRRICYNAQKIKSWFARREFLKEMIVAMFPINKIVPMRSDPLRTFKFQSHPGKSPEAFRLMRWLMKWNELDLSLQVFQSLSRYGYVTSFTSVPFYYLRKILRRALYSHPELAMELYQHFHMSGLDSSGDLFRAIQIKSIKMGDFQLASYLLRMIENNHHHQDPIHQANQISHFLIGFSNRNNSAGNLIKTLLLFEFIWTRWSNLIESKVWKTIINQIKRVGLVRLAQKPEVKLEIENFVEKLDETSKFSNYTEVYSMKTDLMEFLQGSSSFPLQSPPESENHQNHQINNNDDSNDQDHADRSIKSGEDCRLEELNSLKFESLIMEHLNQNQVKKAAEAAEKAISSDILITGPVIGTLLNRLIDDVLLEYNNQSNKIEKQDQVESNFNQEKKLDYFHKQIQSIFHLSQNWRSMSWKFSSEEKGHDVLVSNACIKLFNFLTQIDRNIIL